MSKRRMADCPGKHRTGRIRNERRRLGHGAVPGQYEMRGAGGVWEPGARQWLVERRRIGPVIRELECAVDPLFRRVGIHLDG
jgi:hypothetical protein